MYVFCIWKATNINVCMQEINPGEKIKPGAVYNSVF